MNKSEVAEHRQESGDQYLIVSIKQPNHTEAHQSINQPHSKCLGNQARGVCKANFVRYFYSLTADACIKFKWSGCGGNTNNFLSKH